MTLENIELFGTPVIDYANISELLIRFAFNLLIVWLVIDKIYYPHAKRKEYYFTFMLISISIFFLTFLLGAMKIKTGLVLGLFAIFGIIRYRTETMSVREMTYLFVIITISVINALGEAFSYMELLMTNGIFIGIIAACEHVNARNRISEKLVLYDRIELIVPDKRKELVEDLEKRLGVEIVNVEIGAVDFLKDSAMLQIHYKNKSKYPNYVDKIMKLPKK